ncbi:hypothetical protein CYMTET_20014 [Cymbomonas tetramitiformis]|uniref:Uncharacterized protein n=1 Tax=Cymbomonas tetramitiformis TaxID=36881 RepID=A0AAE0L4L7_9CHLO|nr:hypothetical protein CYMTET_20014 [Cymbomonas tetramitiformis]
MVEARREWLLQGAGGNGNEQNDHLFEDMIGDSLAQAIHDLKKRRNNELVKQMLRAAYRGSMHKIEKLLQQTSTNVTDELGRSALHIAASEGKLEIVEYLLKMGADVTMKDSQSNTPLNDAVRHKHDDVARMLREFDPSLKLTLPGCQAACEICQAAFTGDISELQRSLANGTDVNAADYDFR